MKIEHLQHKHGGRITSITHVAHSTYKRVAEWHYVGSVEWRDGKTSQTVEIAPYAVCFDQGNAAAHAEYDVISKKLNDYLLENGEWHDTKYIGDFAVSWTPKTKEGQVPL